MSRAAAFFLGCLALAGVLGVWSTVADDPVDPAADLLTNRAWVNRMPKSKKDIVTWFIPLEVDKKRFGVAQKSSHYWFAGERFVYTRQGGTLRLTFQQSDRRVELQGRAYDCRGKAPSGFDYCLDLTRKGNTITLYSKKAWKVPKGAERWEVPDVDLTPLADEGCASCVDALPPAMDGLW
jgi:hypothetical protein